MANIPGNPLNSVHLNILLEGMAAPVMLLALGIGPAVAANSPLLTTDLEPTAIRVQVANGLMNAFEDILPRCERLSVGQKVDEAIGILGQPSSVEMAEYLGLSVRVLTWSNLRGQRCTARFIQERLATKAYPV